ncbi:hypothetical protein [Kocuria rhizophila]|uniref:hypothetical protein n=1 Tax=Kocuria rhizophila TaxID=72000 RepID=UPI0011A53475|nr:hypothetical protein [Kocuria rhizophila]
MTPTTSDSRRADSSYDYPNVGAFLQQRSIPNGLHSVDHGDGLVTDVIVADRGAPATVVTFNGAAVEGAHRPYFQGTGLLDEIETRSGPVNRVHVHDALLRASSSLRIGWYLGTPEVDLSRELARLLHRILRQLRRGPVVLFGSSAGGFAALSQGELLPDCVVVAANPQVSLERYEPSLYRKWLEQGGWRPESAPLPSPSEVVSRHTLWDEDCHFTPQHTYLLLNVHDDLHVHSHVVPWLARVASARRLTAVLGTSWGPNHTPAPRHELSLFLEQLLTDLVAGRDTTESRGLGEVVLQPTARGLSNEVGRLRGIGTEAETEIDLRGHGARFAVRAPRPGQTVTVNAGLRASGTHLLRSFLVSVEAERNGQTYTKPIGNAVWSSDSLVHQFSYLPLREGHTRYVEDFTPPSDVSIVAVRLCQWMRSSPAQVFLTDISLHTHD